MSTVRSPRLRRRPSRTVPASVVALVLLAAGALTAVAAVSRLVSGTWPAQVTGPAGSLAALTWGSAAVVAATAVAVVLGLVLLVAGLKPGGFRTARLRAPSGDPAAETDVVISSAALARLAVAAADRVDGVDRVRASADGRHVRVRVTTPSEQTGPVRDQVVQRVRETLAATGVDPAPRVSATVTTKEL
jgi:hypothetical protein